MQSKRASFIEMLVGTLVGFLVSLLLVNLVLPYYGAQLDTGDDYVITAIFTIASMIRSYYMRRFFNWWHYHSGYIKLKD